MDSFFTKKVCDRCKGSLENGRTMSFLNTDCICMKCKEKEKKDPNYEFAHAVEVAEVKLGNYNYPGLFAK